MTIKDVAKEAGVSIATVSNHINKTKPLSRDTEARVQHAIEKLQYTPNSSARSLKSNQYNDVCVLLPNLNDPYFAQIYQGIESTFQNTDYYLNLFFTYDIPALEADAIDRMLRKNVCGLIMLTCRTRDWQFYNDHFVKKEKPLVLIDRLIPELNTSFVSVNYYNIMKALTETLIESGKRNIFLLAGSDQLTPDHESKLGFFEAFAEKGLPVQKKWAIMAVFSKEDAFRYTIDLLKTETPQAILTVSEMGAIGIIEALTLLGYSQDDIMVVTLGEQHWNQYTHTKAFHSYARPAFRIGKEAAELFLGQSKSPKTFERRIVILDDLDQNTILPETMRQLKENKNSRKFARSELNLLMLDTKQVDALSGLIPVFENDTDIKVNMEILPHNYLLGRIEEQHAPSYKGEQSDVFMIDIPWLYSLANLGILEDITAYINDASFSSDIYLPNSLRYFSEFEARNYALPFMYAPQILYYRKDLFENHTLRTAYEKKYHASLKPPRTWTEFNVIAEFFSGCTLAENTVKYGTSIPSAYMECIAPEIYIRMWASGSQVFDRNHNVVFNSPQTLRAYINYKDIFQFSKPNYGEADDVNVVTDFTRGETAMLITYPSFITNMFDLHQGSLSGFIGYSHVPGRRPILGGWSMGINSNSQKKDAAFAFIKSSYSGDIARSFSTTGGRASSR